MNNLKIFYSKQSPSTVSIRGLHLSGKLVTSLEDENEDVTESVNDSVDAIENASNVPSVIPMKAVHSDNSSSLSRLLLTSPYLLPTLLLSLLLLTTLLVCVGVYRYLTVQRRCYYTREIAQETRREWVT